jgi:hypothetical protein
MHSAVRAQISMLHPQGGKRSETAYQITSLDPSCLLPQLLQISSPADWPMMKSERWLARARRLSYMPAGASILALAGICAVAFALGMAVGTPAARHETPNGSAAGGLGSAPTFAPMQATPIPRSPAPRAQRTPTSDTQPPNDSSTTAPTSPGSDNSAPPWWSDGGARDAPPWMTAPPKHRGRSHGKHVRPWGGPWNGGDNGGHGHGGEGPDQ